MRMLICCRFCGTFVLICYACFHLFFSGCRRVYICDLLDSKMSWKFVGMKFMKNET